MVTLTEIGLAQLSPSTALREATPPWNFAPPRQRAQRKDGKRLEILRALAGGPLTRAELTDRLPGFNWKQLQNGLDTAVADGLLERSDGTRITRTTSLTQAGRDYLARVGIASQTQQARQPDVVPAVPAATAASPAATAGDLPGGSGGESQQRETPAAGAGLSAVGASADPRPVTRHLLDAAREELNDYLEVLRASDRRLNRLMLIYHYARQEAGLED